MGVQGRLDEYLKELFEDLGGFQVEPSADAKVLRQEQPWGVQGTEHVAGAL